jgi:hypothetical protein
MFCKDFHPGVTFVFKTRCVSLQLCTEMCSSFVHSNVFLCFGKNTLAYFVRSLIVKKISFIRLALYELYYKTFYSLN